MARRIDQTRPRFPPLPWSGQDSLFLSPREEPCYVMDLEKQVSRRLWGLPTASTCVETDKLWVSVFKDQTATLSIPERLS